MRSSPSLYSQVILTIPYGSEIEVLNINNGWAECTYNGNKGYCSSSYIQLAKSQSDPSPDSDLPPGVFFTQEGKTSCTLSSAAMMLRTRAYQIGKNWRGITESAIRGTAWINGSGLRWSFTYDGMTVSHASYNGMYLSTLISLLNQNPAGLVLYCGRIPHAVWVIAVSGNTIYCADPLSGSSELRTSLQPYMTLLYSAVRLSFVHRPLLCCRWANQGL